MTTSFFSIKTQFENVGDALINREMIRFAVLNGDAVVDISRCPPSFAALLDPNTSGRGSLTWLKSSAALFRQMFVKRLKNERCFYYISPGGYVGDRSGAEYAAGMVNTAALKLMKAIGIRIVHIGVSYERLGPSHIKLLRGRAKVIDSHFARDAESAAYAESLGLRIDGVMPDLAFGAAGSLPSSTLERTEVAFSFRVDQSAGMKATFKELVHEIDAALPPQVPFRFVCQVARDEPFLRDLSRTVTKRPVTFVETSGDIDACMREYDACTHIVSNRLHALLIGLIRGCRPVPLVDPAHNQKIIGIFASLDPSIAAIDINDHTLIAQTLRALQDGPIDADRVIQQKNRLLAIGNQVYA